MLALLAAARNVANGTKRHFAAAQHLVAFGCKADIGRAPKTMLMTTSRHSPPGFTCNKHFADAGILARVSGSVLGQWMAAVVTRTRHGHRCRSGVWKEADAENGGYYSPPL
jgi:hypothetical protein